MRQMKVLVVASDKGGHFTPFIEEQMAALAAVGVEICRFGVQRKGVAGYLREIPRLCRTIRTERPDVLHAHYGLSGLLAAISAKLCFLPTKPHHLPVVTTYHGSDINEPRVLRLSCLAMHLSAWNIFVSKRNVATATRACPVRRYSLIPCGVNLTDDQLQTRVEARKRLTDNHVQCTVSDGHTRWQCDFSEIQHTPVVLFAGAFDNPVKDSELAEQTIQSLGTPNTVLVELRGYDRGKVNSLMCAADCLLLTSKREGSPQVIKEAMACGCPIVSVDVGDVAERIEGIEGCYVANTRDPHEIASLVEQAVTLSLSLSLYEHSDCEPYSLYGAHSSTPAFASHGTHQSASGTSLAGCLCRSHQAVESSFLYSLLCVSLFPFRRGVEMFVFYAYESSYCM